MKKNVYPHIPFSLFFEQCKKEESDEKGVEDGGMQKSFPKLFYKETEENGWDVMIMVSGGVLREVSS